MSIVHNNVDAPFTTPLRERAQAALDANPDAPDHAYIVIGKGRYGHVYEVTRGMAEVCLRTGAGSILGRLRRP